MIDIILMKKIMVPYEMIISMITIMILNYLIRDYDHDDNQDQDGEYDNKV